jgi:hypothetical protein
MLAWCSLRFTKISLTCVIVNRSTSRSACDFYMSADNASLILIGKLALFAVRCLVSHRFLQYLGLIEVPYFSKSCL